MLNFHRERWNPVKKHSKALVFFAVSKQIPIVYLADRGRAEKKITELTIFPRSKGVSYCLVNKQLANETLAVATCQMHGRV